MDVVNKLYKQVKGLYWNQRFNFSTYTIEDAKEGYGIYRLKDEYMLKKVSLISKH